MQEAEREGLEAALARELEGGDLRTAATLAIRGYGPEIHGYLYTLLGSDEEAWEVFSDFSEKLWRSLARFRRECPLRNWAYRIAWSVARDHLKARRRRRERRLYTSEAVQIAQSIRASTTPHLRTAPRDRLSRLRATLEPEEQTLLTLRIDRGFSWEEVAAILSQKRPTSAAALRKRFERLRERLASELAAADSGG